MKSKIVLSIFAVLLAGATVTLLVSREHLQVKLREQQDALLRQADQIAQLEAENERLSNRGPQATSGESSVNVPFHEPTQLKWS